MQAGSKIAVASLLAIFFGAPFAAAQGGGVVSNRLPTIESFSSSGAAVNDGSTGTFSGEARDRNGEDDMVLLKIETVSGPVLTFSRTLTATDRSTAVEPAAFDANGWKVWNLLANADGRLQFKFQYTYPSNAAASYVWRMSVQDEGVIQTGPAPDLSVSVQQRVTVGGGGSPVSSSGTPETGVRWGAWTVDPGATNLEATNYVAITNTGVSPGQGITLDFTDSSFIGVTNSSWNIPLDGNIQFAYHEDTSPSVTAPSEGTYTYGLAAPLGSVTITFTGTENVLYIKYRILSVPETLKDQAYQASYTISAV